MVIGLGKFVIGLLVGLAIFTGAQGEEFLALDEAIPKGGNTTKYAPVFDFDKDGCLPSAGISRDGTKNKGLPPDNATKGCRSDTFMDTSNTLHRYACITHNDGLDYCAHFYSLYFVKDEGVGVGVGHRHDWEYAAIWTTDGVVTHASASAHGSLDTRPIEDVLLGPIIVPEGKISPAIVYHWHCGSIPWCIGGTHALRFASGKDIRDPENPYQFFVTPSIASWYELVGDGLSNQEMRHLLNTHHYNPTIPLRDGPDPLSDNTFLNELNGINGTCPLCPNKEKLKRPPTYPEFTLESIWASNTNNPVLTFIAGDGTFSGEGTEYFIDFGKIPMGRHRPIATLAVINEVYEPADTLDLDFDTTATAPYLCTGCNNFTGLNWGGVAQRTFVVEIPTAGHWPGLVTGEIILQPKGQVDTGGREPLAPIILTMSMEIVVPSDENKNNNSNSLSCSLSPNLKQGGFDPSLISIAIFAFIYIGIRRINAHH